MDLQNPQKQAKPAKPANGLPVFKAFGISEIIDGAVNGFIKNFKLFVLLALPIALIAAGSFLLVPDRQVEMLNMMQNVQQGGDPSEMFKPDQMTEMLTSSAVSGALHTFLWLCMMNIFLAVFTLAVSCIYTERPVGASDIYKLSAKIAVNILVTTLLWCLLFLVLIAVCGGLAYLVFAFLIADMSFSLLMVFTILGTVTTALAVIVVFFARLFVFPSVVALEGKSGISALMRSWSLMSDGNLSFWQRPVIKISILLTIITLIVGVFRGFSGIPMSTGMMMNVLPGIMDAMQGNVDPQQMMKLFAPPSSTIMAVTYILRGLVELIVTPFSMIAVILFYFDVRIRKEGFDLAKMTHEVDNVHIE